MTTLIDRLHAARDAAAEREGDIRIKQLLRAVKVWQKDDVGTPPCLTVDCHNRSWHHHFEPGELDTLERQSLGQLSDTIEGWVRTALANGLMTLSDPPTVKPIRCIPVGAVFTTTFDSHDYAVGSRW